MAKKLENINDIVGQKFNNLTVLKNVGKDKWLHYNYLCQCECGVIKTIQRHYIISGKTKSCGCLPKPKYKYGNDCNERLHNIWIGMKNRCYNPNNYSYKNYGSKGVGVCKEWMDNFLSFQKWSMEHGYNDCLTLDRINVDGNYEPANCKWSTKLEQARNRRNTVYLEYNNIIKPLSEWAEIYGISYFTLKTRHKKGWNANEIINGRTKV